MNVRVRRGSGVYVFRTRKPNARLNIPFLSRHFAYVGETNSFGHRIPQHIMGGGTYNSVAKPWADLDPRVYYIPLPAWKWLMRSVEALLIGLLLPVYNVKMNRANPRRIPPHVANKQRYARNHRKLYPYFTLAHVLFGLVVLIMLVLCIGGAL